MKRANVCLFQSKGKLALVGFSLFFCHCVHAAGQLPQVESRNFSMARQSGNAIPTQETVYAEPDESRRLSGFKSEYSGGGRNFNAQFLQEFESMKSEVQTLRGTIEELQFELTELKKRQRDLYLDLDRRIAGSSPTSSSMSAKTTPAARPSTTLPKVSDAEGVTDELVYKAAHQMLREKNYQGANKEFERLIAQSPNSRFAPNAHYWLGEIYLLSGNHPEAEKHFSAIVDGFPAHHKTADALLKLGMMQVDKGDAPRARSFFDRVAREFPNSASAKVAQRQLKTLHSPAQ